MLAFLVCGDEDRDRALRGGAALRDRLGSLTEPCVLLDADALLARPTAPLPGSDRPARAMALLETLVDRHGASGTSAFVVVLPADLGDDLPRTGFWLRRRHDQHVVRVPAPSASADLVAWAAGIGARLRTDPALRVVPWEPEAPLIRTERLDLTIASPAQLLAYYPLIAGSDVFKTLCWDGPSAPGDLLNHRLIGLRRWARDGDATLGLGMIERSSGAMVGSVSYRCPVSAGRGSVGYLVAPARHGRGYATEAVRAITDHAFVALGVRRVEAEVFVGNVASRRVLEKSGFRLEGTLRGNYVKHGRPVDEWLFSTLREERAFPERSDSA